MKALTSGLCVCDGLPSPGQIMAAKGGGVAIEEAFMCCGKLIDKLEGRFERCADV